MGHWLPSGFLLDLPLDVVLVKGFAGGGTNASWDLAGGEKDQEKAKGKEELLDAHLSSVQLMHKDNPKVDKNPFLLDFG